MHPIALCLHEKPGAAPHLDLFLGPSVPFGEDDRVLHTWRLPRSPMDLSRSESIPIEALGLHRGRYVHLNAPVVPSSGVGSVRPLLQGQAKVTEQAGCVRDLEIRWTEGTTCHLTLAPGELKRLDGHPVESR